ncbi:MAG: hypothetical protein CMO66_06140 [Verrucomicrobiales bacterium]|nr:hypothetical protein [Verrucomicrobiales bacterium]
MTLSSSNSSTLDPLGMFYPNICQACQRHPAYHHEGYVCTACRSHIRHIQTPFCDKCGLPFPGDLDTEFICSNCIDQAWAFDSARSVAYSGGILRDIIHRFKYMGANWFECFLTGAFMAKAGKELHPGQWDGVISTPLHPVKLRERGYNQANCLAKSLANHLNTPLITNTLKRTKATKPQATLSRSERLQNVKDAFKVSDKQSIEGLKLVLVDDVMTTGATVSACADSLKRSGANTVAVWTLARGGLSTNLA